MKLNIKTLSYLLASSGATSGLIDADISFLESGFPFIPARRIKGVLRESLMEIVEMTAENPDYSVVSEIFGNEGDAKINAGIIRIDNAYLKDWGKINTEYLDIQSCFIKEQILDFFTSKISQTTIDNGTAKRGSLRNYRVLNPYIEFTCLISFRKELNEKELYLMKRAIANLRYMGTRRNRGFGKVKCSLIEDIEPEDKNAQNNRQLQFVPQSSSLAVRAETLEPIILSKSDSDQNTVSSYPFISGSKLRGILAELYIKKKGHVNNNDSLFHELFLSGNILYGNLNFEGVKVLPLNLHYIKDKESVLLDVFRSSGEITKPQGGYGLLEESNNLIKVQKKSPQYVSQFHLSRSDDRSAGTSTESQGSIFYYSAVAENQIFEGEIYGTIQSVQKLAELLNEDFIGFLGKSKSAQYGKTRFSFRFKETEASNPSNTSNRIYLTMLSPTILFNKLGVADPSEDNLTQYLKHVLGHNIKVKNRATRTIAIEQFNIGWNAKTEKIAALDAGSVFEIEMENFDEEKIHSLSNFGIGEMRGIGYGKIKITNAWSETKFEKVSSIVDTVTESKIKNTRFKNAVLNEISDTIQSKAKINEIKTSAISDALSDKPITNNHLLGIMIVVFTDAKDSQRELKEYEYIRNWLDKAGKISENKRLKEQRKKLREPKPAFKSLEKAGLADNEDLSRSKLLAKYKDSFSDGFVYWRTYFQTMQKINKQKKTKS